MVAHKCQKSVVNVSLRPLHIFSALSAGIIYLDLCSPNSIVEFMPKMRQKMTVFTVIAIEKLLPEKI